MERRKHLKHVKFKKKDPQSIPPLYCRCIQVTVGHTWGKQPARTSVLGFTVNPIIPFFAPLFAGKKNTFPNHIRFQIFQSPWKALLYAINCLKMNLTNFWRSSLWREDWPPRSPSPRAQPRASTAYLTYLHQLQWMDWRFNDFNGACFQKKNRNIESLIFVNQKYFEILKKKQNYGQWKCCITNHCPLWSFSLPFWSDKRTEWSRTNESKTDMIDHRHPLARSNQKTWLSWGKPCKCSLQPILRSVMLFYLFWNHHSRYQQLSTDSWFGFLATPCERDCQ